MRKLVAGAIDCRRLHLESALTYKGRCTCGDCRNQESARQEGG